MSEAAVYHDDLDEPSSADREAEVERVRVETNLSVLAKHQQAQKEDRKVRAALGDPKRRRSAYLDLAVRSDLTHAEFRCLYVLTTWAHQDLSNCFPGLKKRIAGKLGKGPRTARKLMARLERKGWIKRVIHTRKGSKRQTSNGITFYIPARALPDSTEDWNGPVNFNERYTADEWNERVDGGLPRPSQMEG